MRHGGSIAACACALAFAEAAEATPDRSEDLPTPSVEPDPVVLDTTLGLAVVNRLMEVVTAGSDEPRAYSAPGFFELTAGAEFYPLAPLKASPVVSGLGVFLTFRHHVLLLETSGPTDLGETIEVDTSEQEVLAGVLLKVPLGEGQASPWLSLSIAGGFFEFALDPQAMSLLREEVQMPTMRYSNFVGTVAATIPFGTPAIGFEGSLSGRWVLDVGQAARDLFGSDTEGGSGFDAWVGVGGRFLAADGLHWSVSGGITVFNTEFSGASSAGDVIVDAFPSGTDRYLRVLALMGYAFD